ncbi:MAG: response regulator transcription factor, partial [Lachnospiraceae bacterium]|nr:response regulator transcription factor [Lachnospiraceae bacterium]
MSKIRVLIADDIRILRQGLRAVLLGDADMEVVALCENGLDAYEKTKELKPDVVLMDMRMPEYDGEFGIRKIKADFPEVKILVLTTFDDDETVNKALASGADGYILKESEDEKVIASIKQVHSGMNVFGGSVFNALKARLLSGNITNA